MLSLKLLQNLWKRPEARAFPPAQAEILAALQARLQEASQRRLGRSLAVRHVDTGGCGGCELELQALDSVIYDLSRFGLSFVESPRHADVLLVTGPVTHNMKAGMERAYAAMGQPKWVVAVGDCAIDGGVFQGSYACGNGVTTIPVDLVIRGCPPTPHQILEGLLTLLEANATGG
ncbi:MAG: NADH-quinone oxidoreductase subunit NuoB [Acidobacteriia bacterium]|nr:NADH-quinone oxidoreductase subunit NuoB [Methyloceanibacter sp.]MBX5472300.1 NADH-quinone oxidoreductase subunit NuoB [Acetobacteraceae bacterium]MCL6492763.1 NADH-quinone oxidoreductase subunit NuoB [Terriglobia bacterium]